MSACANWRGESAGARASGEGLLAFGFGLESGVLCQLQHALDLPGRAQHGVKVEAIDRRVTGDVVVQIGLRTGFDPRAHADQVRDGLGFQSPDSMAGAAAIGDFKHEIGAKMPEVQMGQFVRQCGELHVWVMGLVDAQPVIRLLALLRGADLGPDVQAGSVQPP